MGSNFEFCLTGKYSDTGRVRKANEDSMDVFDTANMRVFVVCDGMGGHVGGQIASQTAITAIRDFMLSHVFTDPREAIHNSIIAANEAILMQTQARPELSGMGSTCVMLVVASDGKVYYGHIGDSRLYIVANHKIIQLTKDHSYVQTLVDEGKISKDQAEKHPRKNEITNALGISGMQPPTLCKEPIEPEAGNCFVLCSDGLSGMVDDLHIEHIVSKHEINIQQRAEKLVQMANEAGGKDNITVQLVEFAVSIKKEGTQKKELNKKLFLIPGLVLAFVLLLIVYSLLFGKGATAKDDANGAAEAETEVREEPSSAGEPGVAPPGGSSQSPEQPPTPSEKSPPPVEPPQPVQSFPTETQEPIPAVQPPPPPTQESSPVTPGPTPANNDPAPGTSQNGTGQVEAEANSPGNNTETEQ